MKDEKQKEIISELRNKVKQNENHPNLFKENKSINVNPKKMKIVVLSLIGVILLSLVVKIDIPVSGTARVIPSKSVIIEAVESGIIENLNFIGGDRVEKGKLIGSLRNNKLLKELVEFKIETDIIEKKLIQAEEKVNYLKAMLKRNEELYKEDVIALSELEKIELDYNNDLQEYKIQQDEMKKFKNKVDCLEEALKNTQLIAPISGTIITKIENKIGTFVDEGDEICEIACMDEVLLEFPITEKVLKKITVGDDVSIRFSIYPNKTVKGKVVKIHHVAWEKLKKVLVKENVINVLIKPDSMPFELKSGMTARVKIYCGRIGIKGLAAN